MGQAVGRSAGRAQPRRVGRALAGLLMAGLLLAALAAPAAAQQGGQREVVGQTDDGYLIVVEHLPPQPHSPERIVYLIEDPTAATGPFAVSPRGSGMEIAAFMGVWVIFGGTILLIYRRWRLVRLLQATAPA